MSIEWNKVTWYSKIIAVIVFVATFWIGFMIGMSYEAAVNKLENISSPSQILVQPKSKTIEIRYD
jgi:hypothetical protein